MEEIDRCTLSTVQRNAKNAYMYAIARCSSVALGSMESRMTLKNELSRRSIYEKLTHLRKNGEA